MHTRKEFHDIVDNWLDEISQQRVLPEVLHTCGKCGMSFGRVTYYSCSRDGCPCFPKGTLTVEYTEMKMLTYVR